MSAAEVTPEYVFTCARCRSEWKVYALDAAGSARALLGWTCPECLDLSRNRLDEANEDEVFDDWTRDLGALALLGGMAAAYIGFVRDVARGWIGAIRGT